MWRRQREASDAFREGVAASLAPLPLAKRRTSIRASFLCTVALVWGQMEAVLAWDKDGHEAIGMTTMSALQPEPVAQVKRLMHGRDAVDVAAWAHKVNTKFPWTTSLHFQQQPDFDCGKRRGADFSICPGNKCLVKAIKHFYGRLVSQPMVEIDWGDGIKLTDADCLKYLINLVGDLHQPLHFQARNFTVKFRGQEMPLFDIWDRELAQHTIKESPGFWWGGWTHVQRTRVEFERDGENWKRDGVGEFERWANESMDYLCEHIYTDMTGKNLLPELQSGNFRLGEELFQQWKREMLTKMLVAGARVAIVLNSVLQHREGKEELHAGTAVSGVDEAEDEREHVQNSEGRSSDIPRGAQATRGFQAFGINVAIFVTIQVVFSAIMRHWRGKDVTAQADSAKQRGGGKKT